MKYWDYNDHDGSLEDNIQLLLNRNAKITSITILKYASSYSSNTKQYTLFPIRALILYTI